LDLLKKSFQGLWTKIPYYAPPGQLGFCAEFDMFSPEETEDKEAQADSSDGSVQQGEFDWKEFLKTYCDLTEVVKHVNMVIC